MKTRIEIHLTEQEVKALDKIAEQDGRSRKNYCETQIRLIISSFAGGKKSIKNASTKVK
jgi:hypothetical protein